MARASYSRRAGLTKFLMVWSLTSLCVVTASSDEGEKLWVVTGEDVTLNCSTGKINDITKVTVEWSRKNLTKPVLFFTDGKLSSYQHQSFKNRVKLSDELKNGNLSMSLRNTTLADSGVYQCVFVGEKARRKRSITKTEPITTIDLKVKGKTSGSGTGSGPVPVPGGDLTETGERTWLGLVLAVGLVVIVVFAVIAAVLYVCVFPKFRTRQIDKKPTEIPAESLPLSV